MIYIDTIYECIYVGCINRFLMYKTNIKTVSLWCFFVFDVYLMSFLFVCSFCFCFLAFHSFDIPSTPLQHNSTQPQRAAGHEHTHGDSGSHDGHSHGHGHSHEHGNAHADDDDHDVARLMMMANEHHHHQQPQSIVDPMTTAATTQFQRVLPQLVEELAGVVLAQTRQPAA